MPAGVCRPGGRRVPASHSATADAPRAGFPGPGLRSQPCYLATRSGEPTLTRATSGAAAAEGRGGGASEWGGQAAAPGAPPFASFPALGRGPGEDVASAWPWRMGRPSWARTDMARHEGVSSPFPGDAAAGGGDVARGGQAPTGTEMGPTGAGARGRWRWARGCV